ncbi:hypothetical protein ACGYJ8_19970 [Sulfitobacter sp. 1A12126]|uniref:hypothetical protein n=1 Tax=Sulfitobacter sp. 1A12126 TaxID=3368591 RepID=UPI003744CC26
MSRTRILLAETDVLVAMDLATEFETVGMAIVGITGSVAQVVELIEEKKPDFVLLNVSLEDGVSFPVARRLVAIGPPFAFLTSYEKDELDLEFRDVPYLPKPQDPKDIVSFVANLLGMPIESTQSSILPDEGGEAVSVRR